jgi:hypothetical protein
MAEAVAFRRCRVERAPLLHYELTFSPEELTELPATSFSLAVPHEWVLELAGVPT